MSEKDNNNYEESLNKEYQDRIQKDESGTIKSLGKVDISSRMGGKTDLSNDPELSALKAQMGYSNVPVNMLPSKGRFYPDDINISIRAARVGEIREFSAINENDIKDRMDRINYILANCVKVTYGASKVPGSFKDVLDMDKMIILLLVQEFTFKDASKSIKIPIPDGACKTSGCRPQEFIYLNSSNLIFREPEEEIEQYYSPSKKCYEIPASDFGGDFGVIEMYPPTIGTLDAITNWGIEQQTKQKHFDKQLVSLIPYLVKDWRLLNDKKIFELATEFEGWDINKYISIFQFAEMIIKNGGIEPDLATTCQKCGGEIRVPIQFPNGLRELFVPQLVSKRSN